MIQLNSQSIKHERIKLSKKKIKKTGLSRLS
jgi:hypothetical protein